jgi:hypothetical protein
LEPESQELARATAYELPATSFSMEEAINREKEKEKMELGHAT